MSETFSEAQLFHVYEVVFQALLNGLIVAVAVMLITAIVLILLCCRQLMLETRRKDAEVRAAYEACRKSSGNESVQNRGESSADKYWETASRIYGILGNSLSGHPVNRVNPVQNVIPQLRWAESGQDESILKSAS